MAAVVKMVFGVRDKTGLEGCIKSSGSRTDPEEKDLGYIYDIYSHDCAVWDDRGLQYGRDKVVADIIASRNAFPDLRVVADEMICVGDDGSGLHTSHRTQIFGTDTGRGRFGEPTARRVQFRCLADCVARDNEIFYEHVVYDSASIVAQLGFGVAETARRAATLGFRTEDARIASEGGDLSTEVYSMELLGEATTASFRVGEGLVSIRSTKD